MLVTHASCAPEPGTATSTPSPSTIPSPSPISTITPLAWNGEQIPGVDKGLSGEPVTLPQDVFGLLREKGGAPIMLDNDVVGSKSSTACSVAIPEQLVSGSRVQADGAGPAVYAFDGQPDQLAFWKDLAVPEGVSCVAFVAQDGNKWGLESGTVAVWFFTGGGKAGANVINADNPLRVMISADNSARLSFANNTLTMTTLDSSGAVLESQKVIFLPSLSISLPEGTYTYDAAGVHITVAPGQVVDIPQAEIADRLKSGEGGQPLVLGGLIANPTEKDSRLVNAYFDGSQWVVPDAAKNMRWTPELMQIKGISVPAILEVISQESGDVTAREILVTGEDRIYHVDSGDIQYMNLRNLTLNQRTTETVTVFPGITGREETMYQARLIFVYSANSRIHQVQFLAQGQTGFETNDLILTDRNIKDFFQIGLRYVVDFNFALDTGTYNRNKERSVSDKYCADSGINCSYANWRNGIKFYIFAELKNRLYNSRDLVVLDQGVHIDSINEDR